MALDMTWIAHRGVFHQIAGMCPLGRFKSYKPFFLQTSGSFRPLSEDERSGISAVRLRIARAREGERLINLIKRKQGSWTPAEAAVANAVERDEPLSAGQLIKVPIPEPYRRTK